MFRRHVLGPVLKLAAALPLLLVQADVFLLAWTYLAARTLGVAVSAVMVRQELAKAGVWSHFGQADVPRREVLAFSLPLLASDFSTSLRTSLVTLFIEFFHSAAVLPVVPRQRIRRRERSRRVLRACPDSIRNRSSGSAGRDSTTAGLC